MIDAAHLVTRVAARTGAPSLDAARRAVEATVDLLGTQLTAAEAKVLAADLPTELVAWVRGAQSADRSGEETLAHLAAQESIPRAAAVEYAHVVCQVLAEEVPAETRALLSRRLPAPWCELFHARSAPPPPAPLHHAPPPGAGHTLASGRPGSQHPVADHGAERAHAGSLVRDDNPHGSEKLSSAAAPDDEIATARPDPRRRISDADG